MFFCCQKKVRQGAATAHPVSGFHRLVLTLTEKTRRTLEREKLTISHKQIKWLSKCTDTNLTSYKANRSESVGIQHVSFRDEKLNVMKNAENYIEKRLSMHKFQLRSHLTLSALSVLLDSVHVYYCTLHND